MHLEIQVALNFVISYLYNKLPRRRVNIFGEELEKALRDKFQGHWYPDKPFKGSAFRCLKTGDPIDAVLERAARESGVPIGDILENLPNELSVWIDPGEVSYRISEKGAVKILYSENNGNQEDNNLADREVNKTFNPEAKCFRPIESVNSGLNSLTLTPKTSPLTGSSPLSATSCSPTYKGSPNPHANILNGSSFLQRTQAPLTFTTATFAQTKFGSTKLKTSSKRTNSTSYRMSPTEFSNYIKQRAMQQQIHHSHDPTLTSITGQQATNSFGPIGHPVSPARSLSPNAISLGIGQNAINNDTFYFANMTMGIYPQMNGHHRSIFDSHYNADSSGTAGAGNTMYASSLTANGLGKYNNFLEPNAFFTSSNHLQSQQQHKRQQSRQSPISMVAIQQKSIAVTSSSGQSTNLNDTINTNADSITNTKKKEENAASVTSVVNCNNIANITVTVTNGNYSADEENITQEADDTNSPSIKIEPPTISINSATLATTTVATATTASTSINQDTGSASTTITTNAKIIDGLNSFYSKATGSYQQLLVAN